MRIRMRGGFSFVGIAFLIFLIFLDSKGIIKFGRTPLPVSREGQMNVVASIYPLAYLAQQVGGDKVNVTLLIDGVEPHDFEPSPKDVQTVQNSELFLINGAGLEPWAERVKWSSQKNKGVLSMSESLNAFVAPQSATDPHFWLNPFFMGTMSQNIAARLSWLDPINKEFYEKNAQKIEKELYALDFDYKEGLTSCTHKKFIASHDAFGHLAERYSLEQLSVAGISPESEPSPRHLAELAALIKKEKIPYVFFETLVSPKLAQTLAKEAGAQTLVLNPLEGLTPEEKEAGADYVSVMRENLANLKTALLCK